MKIRKLFKFEAAHRVRSADSSRCKNSIHGHSYLVEVILYSPDNNNMVLDFATLKLYIGDFFDSLDHSTVIWDGDEDGYKASIRKYSRRVVCMKKDPTAENMARAFYRVVNRALLSTPGVMVDSIKVHETATGYAEADESCSDDLIFMEHDNND